MGGSGLLLTLVVLIVISAAFGLVSDRAIHIALTIDETSSKDVLIVANSVVLSAYHPLSLVFHVVVCGKTVSDAEALALVVQKSFASCMPLISADIKPFVLPVDSGFAMQRDFVSAEKRSHWFSPTGADMARFFLASIFPDVSKLLYLDNDIVVSCCVEEVYHTTITEGKVVGIVLDDLKWATVTQFQRQYNASHPLVIKNMRRSQGANMADFTTPISESEFLKALPKYPNDGVLLIDVKKYNDEKILDKASEIAMANARGEYVVGMGTQQFTVLTLYDRWVELTPRGNLRHFPDMARGFLMWFFYNGFIHYAGMAKPRVVCNTGSSDNEHRIGSYTPWATVVNQLVNQCPREGLISEIVHCAKHIPKPSNWSAFLEVVKSVANMSPDAASLVLHIGGVDTEMVSSADFSYSAPSDSSAKGILTGANGVKSVMHSIVRYVLYHSPWSVKVFDGIEGRLKQSTDTLSASLDPSSGLNITSFMKSSMTNKRRRVLRGKHSPKKSWTDATRKTSTKRLLSTAVFDICDGHDDYSNVVAPIGDACNKDTFEPSYEQNARVNAYESKEICKSVLQHIKAQGNKHWDVIGITIDYQPSEQRPWSSSLGVLRNLDLVFMRPKFIVVRVGSPLLHLQLTKPSSACSPRGRRTLFDDVKEVQRILLRSGYQSYVDATNSCDRKDTVSNDTHGSKHHTTEHSPELFACVWGTRVTSIEFRDEERWG
jgi:lipopolysaccharide biosynthesis glycosyltransferase